jgi:hypothetical protein
MFGLGALEILGIVALVLFISRRRLSDAHSKSEEFLHDFAALRGTSRRSRCLARSLRQLGPSGCQSFGTQCVPHFA